jgi:hypothetical protein
LLANEDFPQARLFEAQSGARRRHGRAEGGRRKWKQVTGNPRCIEAYGLTETSPGADINPLNIAEYNGSIGLPIPRYDDFDPRRLRRRGTRAGRDPASSASPARR